MYRSKSKGNFEIPANASSYRSYTILKAAEKANGQPATANLQNGPIEEDETKSFLLNDSVLFSPEKDPYSKQDDTGVIFTPRKNRDCSSAVMETMKNHYIIAMKDLKKGFPSVCELVACSMGVVLRSTEKDSSKDPYEGLRSFLTLQRFLVSCADMRARYGTVDVPDVAISPIAPTDIVGASAETTGVKVVTENADAAEASKKAASDKEKEKNKSHAKRYRRFHFQILIRLAVYKILCSRNLVEKGHANVVMDSLRMEIADLMIARDRYDTWRFMESDIQFRCGNDPFVRKLVSDVCGELLIPLPEYSPERRKSKKPTVVIRSNSKTSHPVSSDTSVRHSDMVKGLLASEDKLRPFPNRHSSGTLQSTAFGRHRFMRQRSCVVTDSASLQRSSSSNSLSTLPELKKSRSLVEPGLKRSSTAKTEDCFQPIFKPTQYPDSLEFKDIFKSNPPPFSPQTPSRPSTSHALSPRGTPYRERQAVLAGILAPDSPSVGPSAFLTSWSPFKRVGGPAQNSNEVTVAPDILKTRRQLFKF